MESRRVFCHRLYPKLTNSNLAQRGKRRSKDSRPLPKPPVGPNKTDLMHHQTAQGHTQPAPWLPRWSGQTLQVGLLAAHLRPGPVRRQEAVRSACFIPGQG